MTQFVYKDKYIQYRGYIFANGNPVVIKDEATDRLLRSHPDFEIFEPKVQVEEVEVIKEIPLNKLKNPLFKRGPGRPARGQ
jgi:hypothetical protein